MVPAVCLLAGWAGPPSAAEPAWLDDVSLWHSEVRLHEDHATFAGRSIDGLVIGNGAMLAVEGMTTEITRFDKSRVMDSRLHGSRRFDRSGNGFFEHLSRSPKVPLHAFPWVAGPVYTEFPFAHGFTFGAEYLARSRQRVIEPDGWDREQQYRIRRTNIVKNVVESGDLRVTALDFVPPELPALIRRITVTNTSAEPVERCRFSVTFDVDPRNWTGPMTIRPGRTGGPVAEPAWPGNEVDFYQRQVRRTPQIGGKEIARSVLISLPAVANATKGRLMLIDTPEGFGIAGKRFFEFDLGRLAPGETRAFSIRIVTAFDESELAATLAQINDTPTERLLDETHAFWIAKLAAADRLARPLRRDLAPQVADYIDGLRTFLLSLHTRAGGSIAHPYSYNAVFTRDGYDTFRAMLALGHQEECRKSILFLQQAMHRLGIAMSYSPREFAETPEPAASRIEQIHGFGHFEKSEYMLFFPLMVRDYAERFGDTELARSVYSEMKRALDSQPLDGDGLVAYSGDEIAVKRGAPLYKYSPQNAALFVEGAGFVARVAGQTDRPAEAADLTARAQRVRATTERRFWNTAGFYAYSADATDKADARVNVFCQALPFFYGYLGRDDVRLTAMLASVKRANMFPSHRVATLPIAAQKAAANNGNTIGLLLYLMCLAGDPDAAAVFDRMLGDAGTMGTTGEYLTVTNDSITRGEMLRAYESSFNLCAALEHLRAH